MSSWVCGAKVRYDWCNNGMDRDCRNGNGEGGVGPAYSSQTGHNDKLSIVTMYSYDHVNDKGAATVFRDSNCVQTSAYFLAGEGG